ncbi:MAG: hypothetical protein IJP18_07250 [Oscillospiraceae bacterium]|nr:hypothetical protein [Oscillospiraceae bacterium]
MATYLIDFENVGSDGLNGTQQLSENDTVIIFYSANSNKLSMEMHRCICKSPAHFEYFAISTGGKNALDFQLSTYLGFLITQSEDKNFYIISKDNGFEHVIKFWKNKFEETEYDISIMRQVAISVPITEESDKISEEAVITSIEIDEDIRNLINASQIKNEIHAAPEDIADAITTLDSTFSKTSLQKHLKARLGNQEGVNVYKFINHNLENNNRQDFHKNLVAEFGQQNGSAVYNKLKKLVKKQ